MASCVVMCGIAGFFSFSGPRADARPCLESMMAAIRHRGPDGAGTDIGPWYALGHLRLAILDPSPLGAQPMHSADGRYTLIYNGEIYNFPTLRTQLEGRGYSFKSNSDTEVLMNGLIEWGNEVFSKLEGMFAGVFLDKTKNEALLFRDHMGIKPFYYFMNKDGLAFASEVKGLLPYTGRLSLNQAAAFEQLRYRMVSGEETLFEGVRRLPAGACMRVASDGSCTLQSYFDIASHISDHPRERADPDEIAAMIDASIRDHTVSDVGYAVQLSGGIDSSYITRTLSREKSDLEAYGVTLPGISYDEDTYQKFAAGKCGVKLHSLPLRGEDFAALLPKTTYHLDFPLVHGGTVFLYALCELIGKKHKVVLTGEGADELFAGYSRYNIPRTERLAFLLKKWGVPEKALPGLPGLRGIKNHMRRDIGTDADSFDMPALREICAQTASSSPFRSAVSQSFSTILGKMTAIDQTAYLDSLLDRQDKISMAHGVEARVPFCTAKLYMRINRIRYADKLANGPKSILKSLLARDFPPDFVYRRKNAFTLPFAAWLREEKMLGQYMGLFAEKPFREFGFINHARLTEITNAHKGGNADHSKELMVLLSFALWARQAGL